MEILKELSATTVLIFIITSFLYVLGGIFSIAFTRMYSQDVERETTFWEYFTAFIMSWVWMMVILECMKDHNHKKEMQNEIMNRKSDI